MDPYLKSPFMQVCSWPSTVPGCEDTKDAMLAFVKDLIKKAINKTINSKGAEECD